MLPDSVGRPLTRVLINVGVVKPDEMMHGYEIESLGLMATITLRTDPFQDYTKHPIEWTFLVLSPRKRKEWKHKGWLTPAVINDFRLELRAIDQEYWFEELEKTMRGWDRREKEKKPI
jgi:hypothetical protein